MGAGVRRIESGDWLALRELRRASLADAPDAFGQTYEHALSVPDAEWQRMARASSSGDQRAWFIGSIDGENVGLVQARRRSPADCLIFSMWVAPGARRTGIGTQLLDAAARWAESWGAQRLALWVFGTNEGAHRFYERIGFRVVPDGPDADSGRAYGALAMERRIER